jgi:hypothetical protein
MPIFKQRSWILIIVRIAFNAAIAKTAPTVSFVMNASIAMIVCNVTVETVLAVTAKNKFFNSVKDKK